MKKIVFNALAVALSMSVHLSAQDKLWQKDLKTELANVNWIEQANNGFIIASGTKGLLALDNNSGEVVWKDDDLTNVNRGSYQNIEGLPLFFAEYKPIVGKARGVIINAATGEIVYDTQDGGYSIKNYKVLPEQGVILFEMASEGQRYVMQFSLSSWSEEWTTAIGKAKGFVSKLENAVGISFIKFGPNFTENGEMIIGLSSEIIVIDPADGQIQWREETGKDIKALVYSPLNGNLYMGIRGSKRLTVYDPSTGTDITPGKLKLRGTLLDIFDDERGHLVLVETAGFNLIDPESGNLIWKKSYKIPFLDEVMPYEKGYIAVGKSEKDGSISLVDTNGDKIWNSKVKGYAYYATPTPVGVLYISTERSNILGYSDGKDIWDKDVKFKAIPAVTFDPKEDKVILFENGNGYKFDLKSGMITQFAEGIDLEDVNKRTPLEAEYVAAGYFITDAQHASLLTPEGKVSYTKYFPPVTSLGLTNVAQNAANIAGLDVDIEGAIGNLNQLKALSRGTLLNAQDQNEGTTTNSTFGAYASSNGEVVASIEVTKKRFYNSKTTKDHKFMVTKQKNNENGRNFIFMLNKSTGEIDKKIELLDKTPSYTIDEVDNRIILNEKNLIITAYQL